MQCTTDLLKIDPKIETESIVSKLKHGVIHKLKKRGVVVGISGGIDSSVVISLCVKAFGPEKVIAVIMPEKESNPDSLILARKLSKRLKVQYVIEDMTSILISFGCYQRRDQAIERIFPEYDISYRAKIVLNQNILEKDSLNLFYLKIISPDGEVKSARLPVKEYLEIMAASNFKQRCRMNMLYYHAESRNYAVVGTSNKNEHDLGFFVKYGDGGSDIKPISHLFKTQVYQLAEYLGVPSEIQKRPPTSDTYPAEQTQEEFFFRVSFEILDKVWLAWENGMSNELIANMMGLTDQQVKNIINDISRKIKATEYLRMIVL